MITLSNRAQSYNNLRAYPKAFEDADLAVKLDSTHVKSLGRRGTAAYYLGKFKVAQRDFLEVLRLDPANDGFLDYLKKVDTQLAGIKREAYERMKRRVIFSEVAEDEFTKVSTRVPVLELHLD